MGQSSKKLKWTYISLIVLTDDLKLKLPAQQRADIRLNINNEETANNEEAANNGRPQIMKKPQITANNE